MQGPPHRPFLIYGHYDVQPPGLLSDWKTPPFEPTIDGENLFARGASDMKGQIMACVAAVEAVLHSGNCPVNIKFLIEGEEETGSEALDKMLPEYRERLACDFVLNPDAGELPDPDSPVITYSLRGIVVFELSIFGPRQDLHSGLFGGIIDNPIHVMSRIIAGLHDAEGRITLPDFYARVRELGEDERAELARSSLGDDFYQRETGAPQLWGEPGYSLDERIGVRPSMDVLMFQAGQRGGSIPASAKARISFRIVPDQVVEEVRQQFQRYLESRIPKTVTSDVKFVGGYETYIIDRNSIWVEIMKQALEISFAAQPRLHRLGGSIGAVSMFQKTLKADSVLTGFSLFDDNIHAPNEKIHLPTWRKGTAALIHFFYNIAAYGSGAS